MTMRYSKLVRNTVLTLSACITLLGLVACKSQEEIKAECGREVQAALANNDIERFGNAVARFRRLWRDDANEVFYLDAGGKNIARTLIIQGKVDYMQSLVTNGRVPAANWVSYVEKPEEFKHVFAMNPDWEKGEPGVERVNALWAVAYMGSADQVDQIYKRHPRLYTRYAELGKDSVEDVVAHRPEMPAFQYFFKQGLISHAALVRAIGNQHCWNLLPYLKYLSVDLMEAEYPVFAACAVKDPKLFVRLNIADQKKLANILDKDGENLLLVYVQWLTGADSTNYSESVLKAILAATENFEIRNHAGEDLDALLPKLCNRDELTKAAQAKSPYCRAADLITQARSRPAR